MKKLILLLLILPCLLYSQRNGYQTPVAANTVIDTANVAFLNQQNIFTQTNYFTATDSSIVVKGIKGFTGQDRLRLLSPGNGMNGMNIYNTLDADQVVIFTGNGTGLYTFGDNYFYVGDGTTGRPLMSLDPPTTSAVSWSFIGDRNTGTLWIAADSLAKVTGGTSRMYIGNNSTTITGNLNLSTVGARFFVAEGSNAISGSAVLSSGTVVVNTTKVTATSRIYLTVQDGGLGATVGSPYVSSRVAGTSFTINSTNISDGSTVAWFIVQPSP